MPAVCSGTRRRLIACLTSVVQNEEEKAYDKAEPHNLLAAQIFLPSRLWCIVLIRDRLWSKHDAHQTNQITSGGIFCPGLTKLPALTTFFKVKVHCWGAKLEINPLPTNCPLKYARDALLSAQIRIHRQMEHTPTTGT